MNSSILERVRLLAAVTGQVSRREPVAFGDGSSEVIVTADVLDKNGNSLGDLNKFVEGALRICEESLRNFKVQSSA